MNLRTTFEIPKSEFRISYSDPVMFIGSCFTTSIGQKLEQGKMPVLINPSGTVYNPVSISKILSSIIKNKKYYKNDLYNKNGKWISFDHYTDFSSFSKDEILEKINQKTDEATRFLSVARFLFITFGTARIYRWLNTNEIVSNCHKIPASEFRQELLSVDEIVDLWKSRLDVLQSSFPGLRVIFTISPVRHWKDGAHGNQISKSVLFLAVEKLLGHSSGPSYFPAYELVMDDLRDYRFYGEDMLHISPQAIDYIWDAFTRCYFDNPTLDLWREVTKITKAVSHRLGRSDNKETILFAQNMISQIDLIKGRNPHLNLQDEKEYFMTLLKNTTF